MPGRNSSLIVRILLVPLFLFGPLAVLLTFGILFPSAPDGVAGALFALYFFYLILAVMLVPAALFQSPDSPSGPSGDGSSGGGGSDTDPPPPTSPPGGPRDGLPLPDAKQARGRIRDHHGPDRRRVLARRTSQEPERAPVPTRTTE